LGAHGIKGEVKLKLESDFAEVRVAAGQTLFVRRPNRRTPRPIEVTAGRAAADDVHLVKFRGVASRSMAQALKGFMVYTRKEWRPQLEDDEYLIRDFIGAAVWNLDHPDGPMRVGLVHGVVPPDELCSPSVAKFMHAMLEVRVQEFGAGDKELLLVPLVPSIVLAVERDGYSQAITKVNIKPPPGLLDLTYTEKKRVSIRGFLPALATISDEDRAQL